MARPAAYRHLVRDGIATKWTKTENVAWKAKLPGQGGSTPVVWEDRIFLTSADGDDLVVMGFDTKGDGTLEDQGLDREQGRSGR